MNPKDTLALLDAVQDLKFQATPKEEDFLQSVRYVTENDIEITNSQATWLQDIYAKASGGGEFQQRHYT